MLFNKNGVNIKADGMCVKLCKRIQLLSLEEVRMDVRAVDAII